VRPVSHRHRATGASVSLGWAADSEECDGEPKTASTSARPAEPVAAAMPETARCLPPQPQSRHRPPESFSQVRIALPNGMLPTLVRALLPVGVEPGRRRAGGPRSDGPRCGHTGMSCLGPTEPLRRIALDGPVPGPDRRSRRVLGRRELGHSGQSPGCTSEPRVCD
jgi:hypothetical protein